MKPLPLLIAAATSMVLAAQPPIQANVQPFRLPNGLQVLLVENHERPLVRLELRVPLDPAGEPEGKAGLSGYLFQVLRSGGAGAMERRDFLAFLENRALGYAFGVHADAFAWSVLAESQGQDGAFESLALAAAHPALDPRVAESVRRELLQGSRDESPRVRAGDRFRRSIGDPAASIQPEAEALQRMEFRDLETLARRLLRPERSVLVIWGDMNLAQARQLAALHLGTWGPEAPAPAIPAAGPTGTVPKRPAAWLIPGGANTVRVQAGGMVPQAGAWSDELRGVAAGLARQELARAFPGAAVAFRWLSPRSWWLQVEPSSPVALPEAVTALRATLGKLGAAEPDAGALAALRQGWSIEQQVRGLHPRRMAAVLADRALQPGEAKPLETGTLREALGRAFGGRETAYLLEGGLPEDAARLERMGLGPVELVD
jgi:hypothetical protein